MKNPVICQFCLQAWSKTELLTDHMTAICSSRMKWILGNCFRCSGPAFSLQQNVWGKMVECVSHWTPIKITIALWCFWDCGQWSKYLTSLWSTLPCRNGKTLKSPETIIPDQNPTYCRLKCRVSYFKSVFVKFPFNFQAAVKKTPKKLQFPWHPDSVHEDH